MLFCAVLYLCVLCLLFGLGWTDLHTDKNRFQQVERLVFMLAWPLSLVVLVLVALLPREY